VIFEMNEFQIISNYFDYYTGAGGSPEVGFA
jgi:hypothetical protein